jgi:hypothetical protein
VRPESIKTFDDLETLQNAFIDQFINEPTAYTEHMNFKKSYQSIIDDLTKEMARRENARREALAFHADLDARAARGEKVELSWLD